MYTFERNILRHIAEKLRERFSDRIMEIYAFGSRVRGDHGEWSDFDILIVVKDRDPSIENEIINIFVEEELHSSIIFTPVIKDFRAFESERDLKTSFYKNIMREGVVF